MAPGTTDRLLCALLAAGPGGPDPGTLQGLGPGLWEDLFRRALAHRVAPLVHERLRPLARAGSVPEAAAEPFHRAYLQTLGVNTRRFVRLGRVLRALRRGGIRAAVLKGAHLAEAFYGNPGLRSMSDLDILVEEKDLGRAVDLLREAGLFAGENPMGLDLHTHLCVSIAGLDISTEAVLARARPVVVAGEEALGLCPEDLLLHLVLHLSVKDLFRVSALRGMCDVRQVVLRDRAALDWRRVARRAASWGMGNAVRLTLLLLDELLGFPVPEAPAHGLGSQGVDPRARAWAREQMFGQGRQDAGGGISPYFWELWRRGSARGKAATLRTLLFPPRHVMVSRYGARFGAGSRGLPYLVRFRSRLAPYVRVLLGLAVGDRRARSRRRAETRNLEMQEWLSSS